METNQLTTSEAPVVLPGSENDEYALMKLSEQQDYWIERENKFNLRIVKEQIVNVKERINQRKRAYLAGILDLELVP